MRDVSVRILHVLDHSVPLQSGYSFRTLALLREQRALGWETYQLTSPKHYAPGPDEEEADGLRFYRTRIRPQLLERLPVVNQAAVVAATAARLAAIARRVNPDILHAHSPVLSGLAALRVGRALGIPVVYEVRAFWEDAAVDHGTTREGSLRFRMTRWLETRVLRGADAVTTICQGLAGDIRARGIAPEKITVVPNGVNIADFTPIESADAALAARLALRAGPVLGFVGSFYGYEGLDLLISALPELARSQPGVCALLVGGGPAEARLRGLAERLGVAQRVLFAGRVRHEDVRRYYSLIDLLVYPRISIRLTELVTPLKPLEAMALGRLFIASDVGGHRELIPPMLRAHLFAPGDVRDLARVAGAVLAARAGWPNLTAAGRRYVSESCTWQLSAARYAAVYSTLARSAAGSSDGARAA
jgi:PEP-CTERM/exosortase A-associated glycosyltransferase